jgi:hypothetical protein
MGEGVGADSDAQRCSEKGMSGPDAALKSAAFDRHV